MAENNATQRSFWRRHHRLWQYQRNLLQKSRNCLDHLKLVACADLMKIRAQLPAPRSTISRRTDGGRIARQR